MLKAVNRWGLTPTIHSLRVFLLSLLTIVFGACADNAVISNKYCNFIARFSYNPVMSVSQLYSACNSEEQWCTITAPIEASNHYVFTNLSGSTSVAITRVQQISGYNMGYLSCGYIFGLPSLYEM